MRHSRDTSRDFRRVAQQSRRSSQPISAPIARAHVEELAGNVKLTQKYVAEEKKELAADKNSMATLAKIETHVEQEKKHADALADLVKGDQIDVDKVIRECEYAEEAAEKALLEQDELTAKLGLDD